MHIVSMQCERGGPERGGRGRREGGGSGRQTDRQRGRRERGEYVVPLFTDFSSDSGSLCYRLSNTHISSVRDRHHLVSTDAIFKLSDSETAYGCIQKIDRVPEGYMQCGPNIFQWPMNAMQTQRIPMVYECNAGPTYSDGL